MSVRLRRTKRGWMVDLLTRFADGQRYRERRCLRITSKSAAQRWGEDRERYLLQHGLPKPKKEVPTLAEFWPRFLDGHSRANRQKPSGIASKEMISRLDVLPAVGERPLDRISTESVQRLKASLTDRAPKTINNIMTVLNTVLKKAVEWDVIDRMPCTIRLVPVPPPSASFHDFEECERLVEAARVRSHDAYLVVLLGGEAGLRRGEITALEWDDIDFKKRQLCVRRSRWKGHVGPPKGGRLRYVPLTLRLAAALQAARHLRGPFVFCDSRGVPVSENVIANHVDHPARTAKLKSRGVHVLRHTFCSHLAMRGAPARAIQELAGHADLRTTQRYMHLSPAALNEAIRLLDPPAGGIARGNIVVTDDQRMSNSL